MTPDEYDMYMDNFRYKAWLFCFERKPAETWMAAKERGRCDNQRKFVEMRVSKSTHSKLRLFWKLESRVWWCKNRGSTLR